MKNSKKKIYIGILIAIVVNMAIFTSCITSTASNATNIDLSEAPFSSNTTTDYSDIDENENDEIIEQTLLQYVSLPLNAAETKEEILYKMLNAIDYYTDVSGIFWYITGEAKIKSAFDVSISGDIVTLDNNINVFQSKSQMIETVTSEDGYETIIISLDNKSHRFSKKDNHYFSDEARGYYSLDEAKKINERIGEKDGAPWYMFRYDLTNTSIAKNALFPQEITFSFLCDENKWNITGETELFGRICKVIKGSLDANGYYSEKLKVTAYEMNVDKETGVILYYAGYNAKGEITDEMKFDEFSYSSALTYHEINDELQELIDIYNK